MATDASHYPERTADLSFDTAADAADTLLNDRVVVIKHRVAEAALLGVELSYKANRRITIPRRLTGRLVKAAGFDSTALYRKVRVSDIGFNPTKIPRHMRKLTPIIETVLDLNDDFFDLASIRGVYWERELNTGYLFRSIDSEAISEHQDSQGATGLAYSPQLKPTLWRIHEHPSTTSQAPAPVSYTFETEPGDIVVLAQRRGDTPVNDIPFRQGTDVFFHDGSVVHSGLNLTGDVRYGTGFFCTDKKEKII